MSGTASVLMEFVGSAPPAVVSMARPEPPWRLLLLGLAWLATAVVASFCVVFLAVFAVGIQNRMAIGRDWTLWTLSPIALNALSLGTLQLMLLFAALRRGRVVGHGDLRVGLGYEPIRRRRVLATLVAAEIPLAIAWLILLLWLGLKVPNNPLPTSLHADWTAGSIAWAIGLVFSITVLAPVAEECFFRGWLWNGLRRHWGPLPVAAMTATSWLMAHMFAGSTRPLFIIPAAIVLSVARIYCGSVRATIGLHVLNNAAIAAITLGALALR